MADTSIMPTITSGNTCSPTLMIAEKLASLLTAESCPGESELTVEPGRAAQGQTLT